MLKCIIRIAHDAFYFIFILYLVIIDQGLRIILII